MHNFLFDLLLEKDYFFNSKLSRKTLKTYRFERIQNVFYDGKMILDYENMLNVGKNCMNFLNNSFNDERSLFIEQNNPILLSLHPLFNESSCSV